MQLRSGVLKAPPTRKYISPYSVFYQEKAKESKYDGKKSDLKSEISELWREMSDEEKEKYEQKFDQAETKFKNDLILYYGGNQKDVQKFESLMDVPEKPKKPISAVLAYCGEKRKTFGEKNPELSQAQIGRALVEQYQDLSQKERKKYEDKYDQLHDLYQKELKIWEEKYSKKSEQFEALIEEKFRRVQSKEQLEYQELPPYKRQPKKIKDEDDTAPEKEKQQMKMKNMKKDDMKKEDKQIKEEIKPKVNESKKMNDKDLKNKDNRKKSLGKK